jgi:SAM-dependent methyltransferase
MDVVELRDFYQTPLGLSAKRKIVHVLRQRFVANPQDMILGLGFAHPYLDDIAPENSISLSFMMARQGVIHWPLGQKNRSALIDENDLPLLESTADHVVVIHGLELAETPLEMLQEIWRVLAPQGKLYLVVPNRRGLWAAFERGKIFHKLVARSLGDAATVGTLHAQNCSRSGGLGTKIWQQVFRCHNCGGREAGLCLLLRKTCAETSAAFSAFVAAAPSRWLHGQN